MNYIIGTLPFFFILIYLFYALYSSTDYVKKTKIMKSLPKELQCNFVVSISCNNPDLKEKVFNYFRSKGLVKRYEGAYPKYNLTFHVKTKTMGIDEMIKDDYRYYSIFEFHKKFIGV